NQVRVIVRTPGQVGYAGTGARVRQVVILEELQELFVGRVHRAGYRIARLALQLRLLVGGNRFGKVLERRVERTLRRIVGDVGLDLVRHALHHRAGLGDALGDCLLQAFGERREIRADGIQLVDQCFVTRGVVVAGILEIDAGKLRTPQLRDQALRVIRVRRGRY